MPKIDSTFGLVDITISDLCQKYNYGHNHGSEVKERGEVRVEDFFLRMPCLSTFYAVVF